MFNTPLNLAGYNGHLINSQRGGDMSKQGKQADLEEVERAFKAIGDTLRRAAQNADALDLKPKAKAWLLDQFGSNKPKTSQPLTEETYEYARDIIRQQEALEKKPELKEIERAFKAIGDTLRRAAQNADALDLKPEVKAWLLDQFEPNRPKAFKSEPDMDKNLKNAREVVRQQLELEQRANPTSGKSRHAETEQRRRKSKQTGDDLPPH
jgi:hypothetical protein